ncbi:nap1-related protein 2 [Phtheirospermum japonicum]|uniref:Nap1-related protein 2 n=1 Tax=Phtheirospermum japonicum TaxID=374723 RepID=A0A830C6E7_9LAMI|nr:nap1-related protein 2 [Phtheirospermum japonicum]
MVSNGAKRSRIAAAENVDQFDHDDVFFAIEKLQEAQDELDEINEEANKKILAIEKKYNEVRETVYIRRNEIISSIPDFWLTSFLNHHVLGNLLNEEDRKIFSYMESLHVEKLKDVRRGYCITFNFKANPYFENAKLSKTINFSDDGTLKSTGTTIKWKPGKAPADIINDDMKEGNKRPLPQKSFRPDTLEVDQDWVAELIKEELWTNPIEFINYDDDDTDGDGDGDDEDDELEEEDEDDEQDGSGKDDE